MRWGRRRTAQTHTSERAAPVPLADGGVNWPQGFTAVDVFAQERIDGLGAWPPEDGYDGDDGYMATDPSSADEVDTPAPVPARKGGRNMTVATIVGIGLFIVAMFAAWFDARLFAVVVYGFMIAAVLEWRRALLTQGRAVAIVPLVLATLGMGSATWYGKAEGLTVAVLVGLAGMVAWRVVDERIENTLADSLASMFSLLWIPFLGSFVILMEQAEQGWLRVVIFVIAVVGNDTGGLFAGMAWGKHKLLERVSPNKTWEGFFGGVVLGTVAAGVASWLLLDGRWWIGAVVGFGCTIAAVVGDLAESALKRDIQLKDMSSLIPGHGGVMDRLDSMLMAAPVAYVIFAAFLGTVGGR